MIIQKNNIYQGSRERKSLYDVFYKNDGKKKPVVIFSHGFKGFKDQGCFDLMANFFAEKDFAFIKYNFSYNGGTLDEPIDFPDLDAFGHNNYTTELNDLDIIISKTIAGEIIPLNEINIEMIYIIGHSRGGGITILKGLTDDRVKKFVSLGAITNMNRFNYGEEEISKWKSDGVHYIENARTKQMMPLFYQFYENFISNQELLNIEKQVQKLNKPYLNIHGDEDETVSVDEAYRIKKWNDEVELHIVKGATHSFGSQHPYRDKRLPKHFEEALNVALEFFRK